MENVIGLKLSKTDFIYEQISGRIMSGAYALNMRIPPKRNWRRSSHSPDRLSAMHLPG